MNADGKHINYANVKIEKLISVYIYIMLPFFVFIFLYTPTFNTVWNTRKYLLCSNKQNNILA